VVSNLCPPKAQGVKPALYPPTYGGHLSIYNNNINWLQLPGNGVLGAVLRARL